VSLALGLQSVVHVARHAVIAHILHRAVELLQAVRHRLLAVHRVHRREQLAPGALLKVVGQLGRLLQRLDHELARWG